MAQHYIGEDIAPEVVPFNSPERLYQPEPHVAGLYQPKPHVALPDTNRNGIQRRANIIWAISTVIIVIAAAVGGGVGGSLAVQNARNSHTASQIPCPSNVSASSATLSVTSTMGSYTADATNFVLPLAPTAITSISTPSLPCPTGQSVGTYNSTAAFKTYCHETYAGTNLAVFIAYSFADCQDACLSYNAIQGSDVCIAASMAMNLASWILSTSVHGNCYLKTAPLTPLVTLDVAWTAVLCKDQYCNTWYP